MNTVDQLVERLRSALADIESKLLWGDLPVIALEEFKLSLDSVRTSIQAFVDAEGPAAYGKSLRQFRLRRGTAVSVAILSAVRAGTVTARTPGFSDYRDVLQETLGQLDRLLGPDS